MLLHLVSEHNSTENLCTKCYRAFAKIESHISKCNYPINNETDQYKIHNYNLNRKKKRKSKIKTKSEAKNFMNQGVNHLKNKSNSDNINNSILV